MELGEDTCFLRGAILQSETRGTAYREMSIHFTAPISPLPHPKQLGFQAVSGLINMDV